MALGGRTGKDDVLVEEQGWGHLEWMVSRRLGNSETMTVGKCFILPGQQNPLHHHPNCDEVLHVLQGTIVHRVEDEYMSMGPGDTISIPSGTVHNAKNVGHDEAVFMISFSSADREVIGE